jgi:hypothetical protein
MASVRFTDVQARPMEFLDLTSLTLAEFQGCDRSIPNARIGCETLDSQAARRFRLINDFRLARGLLWWDGGCAQPPSFLL